MRSSRDGSRTPPSPLDNAFSPAYLARLRERDDSLTAAEAELAGPWKIEPVPGRPGAVAILRVWEDLAIGDPPVGVLWHLETAELLSVLLPAAEGLHLLEAIVRSPWALATLLDAAGPGVEEQVGRIRARRQPS